MFLCQTLLASFTVFSLSTDIYKNTRRWKLKLTASSKLLRYWAGRLGNVWALDFGSLYLFKINGEERKAHLNLSGSQLPRYSADCELPAQAPGWSSFRRFQGRGNSVVGFWKTSPLVAVTSSPDTQSPILSPLTPVPQEQRRYAIIYAIYPGMCE